MEVKWNVSTESIESNECKIIIPRVEIAHQWDDTGESILAILEMLERE